MKIVVYLGGSVVTRNLTPEYVRGLVSVLRKISDAGNSVYVVVGAGHVKNEYVGVLRGLGLPEEQGHDIAIQLTHLNANMLRYALEEKAHNWLPKSTEDVLIHAELAERNGKICVCGGTEPGQSTDGVASRLAHHLGADLLVKATNVDGVYDSDPKENPQAKKLDKLNYSEFLEILASQETAPGRFFLFGRKGAELLKEKSIRLLIVNGKDPEEISRAVFGGHNGTEITSDLAGAK
ncbi:MAG: UMP kinase [Candidatus Aenigmarchaeota archaeon]|nr:UMP kinase [Candidatus Aenigmarchaeota archaeon]